MLGAIGHTVPLLTALDYCSRRCTFALKSRPFLGTQRILLGQATGDEPPPPQWVLWGTQSMRGTGSLTYLLEVYQRPPDTVRTRVKMLSGGQVVMWVGHQGQVVGQVCPLVMNVGPLGGHSHVISAALGSCSLKSSV
jgi:hypothetical protein